MIVTGLKANRLLILVLSNATGKLVFFTVVMLALFKAGWRITYERFTDVPITTSNV